MHSPQSRHLEELSVTHILGKQSTSLSAAEFATIKHAYSQVMIDIGTGDGKHVLRWARKNPEQLCVGIDANSDSLVKTSSQTSLSGKKGKLSNCLFIQSSADKIPAFIGPVQHIHILMPWGSLLRDLVCISEEGNAFMEKLRSLGTQGTELVINLNLHAWRPQVPEVGDSPEPTVEYVNHTLAHWFRRYEYEVDDVQLFDPVLHDRYTTSWAKKVASSKDTFAALYCHAVHT